MLLNRGIGLGISAIWTLSSVLPLARAEPGEAPPEVSFIRDIAPILVGKCQSCHGTKTAESNYRVDTFDGLMTPGDFEMAPVTAGDLDESEFHRLITASDPDERMPNNGDRLTDREIKLIDAWIKQGAKFDGHDRSAPLQSQLPPSIHPAAPQSYPAPVPLTALLLLPEGKSLLAGGYHEVTVWDPATGMLAGRIGNIPERVFGLQLHPEGKWLAVAGGSPGVSGEVRLIPWENGKPTGDGRVVAQHDDVFFDVVFRPDGQQLAAACADGSVRLIAVDTGEEQLRINNHADWVTAAAYSADGKLLATGSRDKTSKVFKVEDGELTATHPGNDKPVSAVAFSADGKQVVSGSGNQLRIWKVEDAKLIGELNFGGEVYDLRIDAESVLAGAADRTVRRFTLADRKETRSAADHPDWVLSLAWRPDAQQLVAGCFDGSVSVWNFSDGSLIKRFLAMPGSADGER